MIILKKISNKYRKNKKLSRSCASLAALALLALKASIFNGEAMESARNNPDGGVKTIAHHFLVDVDKREIGLIQSTAKLLLPRCEVLDTELSDQAMKEWTKNQTGIDVSAMYLVGEIECTPEKNKKLFSFSGFLSLFGLSSADNSQNENQISASKITYLYYFSPVHSGNPGIYWVSIPSIYQQYGQLGAMTIEPEETVDILQMMTNFRRNLKFDLKNDIPSIAKNFNSNKIKIDVDGFIPISFQDEYFKGRLDLQDEIKQKQDEPAEKQKQENFNRNKKNLENVLLLPAGIYLMGMYASNACTIQ